MARMYDISEELAKKLRREYEDGDNTTILAKRYDISRATVSRNIRRVGGKLRKRTVTPPPPRPSGLLKWINS